MRSILLEAAGGMADSEVHPCSVAAAADLEQAAATINADLERARGSTLRTRWNIQANGPTV